MFKSYFRHKKRFYLAGIALLCLGLLFASFAWVPRLSAKFTPSALASSAASASSILTLSVQPYPLPSTVYEVGQAVSHVVATGTDLLGPGNPVTATIDWGDKTTPTQYTFIDNPTFQVAGTHAYSKLGKYTITVTAAIAPFQQSVSGTGTITVVPAYMLKVRNIRPTLGHAFHGTVVTGTDPFPHDALKGTIDWGDGTTPTSVQVVSSARGKFQVNATHTYTRYNPTGSSTITVSLTSVILGPITGTGTATPPPAFTLKGGTLKLSQSFNNSVVATLTGTISQGGLVVAIEWGDQLKIHNFQLPGGETGHIQVKGSHVYNQAGTYTITITVMDLGTGEQAFTRDTATVG